LVRRLDAASSGLGAEGERSRQTFGTILGGVKPPIGGPQFWKAAMAGTARLRRTPWLGKAVPFPGRLSSRPEAGLESPANRQAGKPAPH